MKKDLESLKGLLIAHRGIHSKDVPENSLKAFQLAINKKIAIELDIQLLKDDSIIVFHDRNLKRMTGVDRKVSDCTYPEISTYFLGGTSEKIPLLQEVLKQVNGKVLIDIEFKSDFQSGSLEKKASVLLDSYSNKFVVKSFDICSVRWFQKHRPNYTRGLLVSDPKKTNSFFGRWVSHHLSWFFYLKPDFIACQKSMLPNKVIAGYRKQGYPVFVWTLKTEQEQKKWKNEADSFLIDDWSS